MLVEAFTAVGLVFFHGNVIGVPLAWAGLILLAIIWLSTALLQVPKHDILSRGWNERAGKLLCSTNWIRTIAWTARAILMFYLLRHLLLTVKVA